MKRLVFLVLLLATGAFAQVSDGSVPMAGQAARAGEPKTATPAAPVAPVAPTADDGVDGDGMDGMSGGMSAGTSAVAGMMPEAWRASMIVVSALSRPASGSVWPNSLIACTATGSSPVMYRRTSW